MAQGYGGYPFQTATVWAFTVNWSISGTDMAYSTMSNTLGTEAPWSSWDYTTLPTAGCNTTIGVGEISAARFEMQSGERIVLVFPDDTDGLCYLIVDPANPSAASTWSLVPGWPTGVDVENATLSVVNGELAVVFMDPDAGPLADNVYLAIMDDAGTWTTQPSLISGITTYLTPGLADATDGNVYMVTVEDDSARDLQYWRKPVSNLGSGNGWSHLPGLAIISGLSEYETNGVGSRGAQRLTLLFLRYLNYGRDAFLDGSGYLAVFWNVDLETGATSPADEWRARRAYTTGYIGSYSSNLLNAIGYREMGEIQRPNPAFSLGIDARANGAAMYFTGTSDWHNEAATFTHYVPYATGLSPLPAANHDHNDAATINANMCRSVWLLAKGPNAACYCDAAGDPNYICGPPTPPSDLEEPCAPPVP